MLRLDLLRKRKKEKEGWHSVLMRVGHGVESAARLTISQLSTYSHITMTERAGQRCIAAPLCRVFRAPFDLWNWVTSMSSDRGHSQALIFGRDGQLAKLGVSWTSGDVSLGAQMRTQIREAPLPEPQRVRSACWDAYSGSVYAIMGQAVVRLSEDGNGTVVAGHPTEKGREDGAGLSARFDTDMYITSDGEGRLYVAKDCRLRRLQLPAAWRAGAAAGTEAAPQGGSDQQQQQQQQGGAGTGPATEHVQVTTIELDDSVWVEAMAYDPVSRSLVLCMTQEVCRLPVEGLGAAAAGTVHEPVLVAGYSYGGFLDGVGERARFTGISGVAVDGMGTAWVLDYFKDEEGWDDCGTRLRRVDTSGRVETVPAGPLAWYDHHWDGIAVLQDGCLAVMSSESREVLLLQTGPIVPAPGTLSSDLGELLDRQPDGSTDVEVEVGGQVFAAHRGVLAARSPYFRQRLDPGAGFADGRAPRLSLPDADPAAFGAVLRFMYTDSAGPVPPELLHPVGELADRLLLPGLCAQVGSQLLGRVCVENVVDLLLWAERYSGSFGALLGGLKEWFLEQYSKPGEEGALPQEELKRLMQGSPDLVLELRLQHRQADGQGGKRKRQE